MKTSTIESIDKIHLCSKNAAINWRSIKFPEFQSFTYAVQKLINAVGEIDDDDYWFSLVRRIRKFRFDSIASPFSDLALQMQLQEVISRLRLDKIKFSLSHPNAFEQYNQLLIICEQLTIMKLSQLLISLATELDQQRTSNTQKAVLVCETRLISSAEQGLRSAGINNVEVVSPRSLGGDTCFENMVIIGPTRWYPEYVFSAPRAENLLVLKYSWIRDSWKHENEFVAPLQNKASKLMETFIDEPFDNSSFAAEELLPPVFDFQQIKKRIAIELIGHSEVEYVQAKLFLLEEGWAVILETDETSSVLVIDLRDLEKPVKKIKADEIEANMFVLLRTSGGGDFIIPVADQIMGEKGVVARDYQHKWKSLLRSKIISVGYEKVISDLRKFGSIRANRINVHNWMSYNSIKTEYKEDFYAIMKFVDLEKEAEYSWGLMEIIDHAHRRAGHQIRSMLLDKVKKSDLSTLQRTGKMNFELVGEHSISITAFQIKEISPETIQVLPWQIGNPIEPSEQ